MATVSIKKAFEVFGELTQLQAQSNYASINAAIGNVDSALQQLDSDTTITFGNITSKFDSNLITKFGTTAGNTDISSYTANSKLKLANATALAIEIANFQAADDHASIQAVIDAANQNVQLTEDEIVKLFPQDVQTTYNSKHSS